MADQQLMSEAAASPTPYTPTVDHAPSIPSPLNPDVTRARPPPKQAIVREQREKKETLKKRESVASTRGPTPDAKPGFKAAPRVVGPIREGLPEPEIRLYDAPRDLAMASHEPKPIFVPGTNIELKRPVDW